ncbi:hypothetical protein ATO4_05269 [Aurantimonas sp. 22II-16-19i]|nr:hypothetical protein ATO4_05269 [Aurantimonas sp. 22II-16-19i]
MHSTQHLADRAPCHRRRLAEGDLPSLPPPRSARIDGLSGADRPAARIGRAGEDGWTAGLPSVRRSVLGPGQAKTFVGALF